MKQADLDTILLDPADRFENPEAVLKAGDLDRSEKISILRRWLYDANEVAVAEEEGMSGPPPELVRRISLALESLGFEGGTSGPSTTKQGGA